MGYLNKIFISSVFLNVQLYNQRMTKIIVFGSTGQTGIQCARKALEMKPDNEVTVFLRTPSRLPHDLHSKVTIIVGDVMDKRAVVAAIKGLDAVLSALGPGKDLGATTVTSTGVKNIVAGMKEHKVKKFVMVGNAYLLEGYFGAEAWKDVFKEVTADHTRAVNVLNEQSSDVGWVCVNPPEIVDQGRTGNYAKAVEKLTGSEKVTTGDMAHAMVTLACSDDDTFAESNRKMLGICFVFSAQCPYSYDFY